MARGSRPIDSMTYTKQPRELTLPVTKRWNWLGLRIPRTNWTDPDEHLEVTAEWTADNGKTHTLLVGFTTHGGPIPNAIDSLGQTDNTPPADAELRVRVRAPGKPVTRDLHLVEDDETPTMMEVFLAHFRRR